jgi:hypothetical protein
LVLVEDEGCRRWVRVPVVVALIVGMEILLDGVVGLG